MKNYFLFAKIVLFLLILTGCSTNIVDPKATPDVTQFATAERAGGTEAVAPANPQNSNATPANDPKPALKTADTRQNSTPAPRETAVPEDEKIEKASDDSDSRVQDHIDAGKELADQGFLDRAIAEFDKAIKLDPQNSDSYTYRGIAYKSLGQFDEAIQDYNQAILLSPNSVDNYYNRANAYTELGQHLRAIEDYGEALRLKPGFALAHGGRGKAHLLLGQNSKAIEEFSDAIRIDPEIGIVFNMRGLAHRNLGDYQLAIDDYNQAIIAISG